MRSLLLSAALIVACVGPACAVATPGRVDTARAVDRFRGELARIEGSGATIPDDDPSIDLFGEVLTRVVEEHVKPHAADALVATAIEGARAERAAKPDSERLALTEAALRAMTKSLDPYSEYLDTEAFRYLREQTEGSFGGIGLEVSLDEPTGFIRVNAPIDGSPAASAGVRTGDLITDIDGRPIKGLRLSEAVGRLRGPIGTAVDVTTRRGENEIRHFRLIRAVVQIQSIRKHLERDDIGYIRIASFNQNTTPNLDAAVSDLLRKSNNRLNGLIIDVRNDLGGLLDQAIKVSDRFLGSADIVSVRGRAAGENRVHKSGESQLLRDVPMVVLVNSGSASASEIVAGALRDNGRAELMGVRTYGKGSVQTLSPIGEDAGLRLTTARYYRPSGALVDCFGLTPDISVSAANGTAKEIHADPAACDPAAPPPPPVATREMGSACPATAREAEETDGTGDGDSDKTVRCAVEYLAGRPLPPAAVKMRSAAAKAKSTSAGAKPAARATTATTP